MVSEYLICYKWKCIKKIYTQTENIHKVHNKYEYLNLYCHPAFHYAAPTHNTQQTQYETKMCSQQTTTTSMYKVLLHTTVMEEQQPPQVARWRQLRKNIVPENGKKRRHEQF